MCDEVLLFNETQDKFATALLEYTKRFPEKQIVAIAPQTLGGETYYNIVVVRDTTRRLSFG